MSKSAGKFKLPKSAGNSNSPNAEKCGKVQIEIQFHKYKKKTAENSNYTNIKKSGKQKFKIPQK